jgi:hypothetical protein
MTFLEKTVKFVANRAQKIFQWLQTDYNLCCLGRNYWRLFYVATSFDGLKHWSGKRGSNPRPQAWEACALPTELFPHGLHAMRKIDTVVNIVLERN